MHMLTTGITHVLVLVSLLLYGKQITHRGCMTTSLFMISQGL
jgi:hypothetical protein